MLSLFANFQQSMDVKLRLVDRVHRTPLSEFHETKVVVELNRLRPFDSRPDFTLRFLDGISLKATGRSYDVGLEIVTPFKTFTIGLADFLVVPPKSLSPEDTITFNMFDESIEMIPPGAWMEAVPKPLYEQIKKGRWVWMRAGSFEDLVALAQCSRDRKIMTMWRGVDGKSSTVRWELFREIPK